MSFLPVLRVISPLTPLDRSRPRFIVDNTLVGPVRGHKINTVEVGNSTNYSDNRGRGIYVRTHADVVGVELIVRVHTETCAQGRGPSGYKLSCSINRAANMHEEGVAHVVVAPGRVDFGNVISRP